MKNCLTCRVVMHVIPIDRPVQGEDFKYLVWCDSTSQKFFTAPRSLKTPQKWAFSPILEPQIAFWVSIKSKKCVPAHVLQRKSCFMRRMIIPFASTHSYDPKQVFQDPHWHWYALRKIFLACKSSTSKSLKHTFFEYIWFKPPKQRKNEHETWKISVCLRFRN